MVTLKATTLRTLLESDGTLPPVLPLGSYEHNKSEKIIRIKGGGEIVYFGLDDPEKIGSYNLSGVAVDEAVELLPADWVQLLGRIRLDIGLPNQIYAACNPAAPTHFLAEKFGLTKGHKKKKGCRVIQTKSADNFFLPETYIESLNEFSGVAYKRFVEGKWVGSEGTIYDRWDRHKFVAANKCNKPVQVIVGVDAGYTNPAAHVLIFIDSDDNIHIKKEWYKTKQLEPAVIQHAVDWQKEYSVESFVVDPSAASLIAGMRAAGLFVIPAMNEVFSGIQAVQARLTVSGNGEPRLTVDPSCEKTIQEFETYEWKQTGGEVRDVPVKKNDHSMDAIRYAVSQLDSVTKSTLHLDSSTIGDISLPLENDDDDDWESY